jgi:spermidine synthase
MLNLKSFLTHWNRRIPLPAAPPNPETKEIDIPTHNGFFSEENVLHSRLTSKNQYIEIKKGMLGGSSLYIDGEWQAGTDYEEKAFLTRNDWGDDCHLTFLDILEFSGCDLPRAKILIIGGGDLGLSGLLIENGAACINQYELDEEVVEVCKKYTPSITMPALLSGKVNIKYCDGFEEIKKNEENTFDAIIGDLTGPGAQLFNDDKNLESVKLACKNHGVIITHIAQGLLDLNKIYYNFRNDTSPNFAVAIEGSLPQHAAWSTKKLIKDTP